MTDAEEQIRNRGDHQQSVLLDRGRRLLGQGKIEECRSVAAEAVEARPDDVEALYLLAVAQRYGKRSAAALTTLDRLLDLDPDYSRAYQECGHLLRGAASPHDAIVAYGEATRLNPALKAAWFALAELLSSVGRREEAARAMAQFDYLGALSPPLLSAMSFLHDGKLGKAEKISRDILQRDPANVEAMHVLAQVGVAMNVLDDAEYLLESALAFDPGNLRVHTDYVGVLQKQQRHALALVEAEKLLARDPANPVFRTLVANARLAAGDFDAALAGYDAVLLQWPKAATIHLSRGHALKTIGRPAEAVSAYRNAYRAEPSFGDAFWSLANLKTYRFSQDELDQMMGAEADPRVSREDRVHLRFALGKALEDRGEFARSFGYYESGNALQRSRISYDPDIFDREVADVIARCDRSYFAARAGFGAGAPDPIFIVGLPRAGSTLVEQILASHSAVDGTAELPYVIGIAHQLDEDPKHRRRTNDPAALESLTAASAAALGAQYLEQASFHRGGRPRFIDKMPNNFRHIALIHLMLPNAKIIDVRRDAMGCCFSGFKQLFAQGQEFSYSLADIGRYYRGYARVMDHWADTLPGRILNVRYEDVVVNLEEEVRRILDYCELPFEESCIRFHETKRAVRTASSEQVRQPLYRSGLDQWRNYEPFLGELRQCLAGEERG
jgi:tetratricopeptide (TPR) repeat protein